MLSKIIFCILDDNRYPNFQIRWDKTEVLMFSISITKHAFLLDDLICFKKLHPPPLIQAEICGKDVKTLFLQTESLVPGTYLAN